MERGCYGSVKIGKRTGKRWEEEKVAESGKKQEREA